MSDANNDTAMAQRCAAAQQFDTALSIHVHNLAVVSLVINIVERNQNNTMAFILKPIGVAIPKTVASDTKALIFESQTSHC